jgi:hypothetical protein
LTHTIVGLVDENGVVSTVAYHDWLRLVHEADNIFAEGEEA